MSSSLGTLLEGRTRDRFVGREAELKSLTMLLDADGPRVLHLTGPGGIGKSVLLDAWSARTRATGAAVIHLDCRTIEPSVPRFLEAAAAAAGAREPTVTDIAARLEALGDPVILVLDTYERFWLMDTFLRRDFCPLMPDAARLLLAGRERPATAWLSSPEWHGLFQSLELGPLPERDALACLRAMGLETETARRVNRVAHGHPLALAIAAQLSQAGGQRTPEDIATGAVVDVLAREYLAAVPDPATREALEASSVIRRTTEPLLRSMLPGVSPADTMERLRNLPVVESASDGLFVHDVVREAIATGLRAADPERHRRYRAAAWQHLKSELPHTTAGTLWRYTADILYLLENPVVREAFFPSGYQPLSVEPATAADGPAIAAIATAHCGPIDAGAIAAWWERKPWLFRVARDIGGGTRGYLLAAPGREVDEDLIAADPLSAAWAAEMAANGSAEQSLLLRHIIDGAEGEGHSASRGVFGLDVKRTYMEMRPGLRYIYLNGRDPADLEWCGPLGFRPVPAADTLMDGRRYLTLRLDMGPGSVEGWLSRVVADELGIPASERAVPPFDREGRQLIVDGVRHPLTPLEFGVMNALVERNGRPVTRADLMETVWGYDANGTSNVVEAVVLALRRKLGAHAAMVETVRGVGYRYCGETEDRAGA